MFFASSLLMALSLFAIYNPTAADPGISKDRIKVFLFASPAFWGEVAIDAYKNQCIDLDNNLIDGSVQSILIGAHDIPTVMKRTDDWYCMFYDNYDCTGNEEDMLVFAAGVNNLRSVRWETKIHALKCIIENDDYDD
ncbi:hypothetical protein BU24DRAFT_447747 [Aaosphaeria arxii CBS 175.79]|uniref:Uncharacterized protein n=1 Tax=Aaosphaeria arxii CBS 175.79 TaxID=1450172 RepID=A0A6A5Y2Q8_9PLEO|nr:uncharacterized protein BU24DRAFT_447747 [Aaosphaeria arxii CBS 175.79]KAF2019181.1 hypothetical protein BU24DRAFT_447747 [Aaosphaeria arxii CBS 175.79]